MKQTGEKIIPSIGRPSKKGYSQICFVLAVSLWKIELRFDHCSVGQSREVCYINCYGRGTSDGICSVNNITKLNRG